MEEKMKKRIALFLVAALVSVGLIISCGGGGKDDPENPDGPGGGPGTPTVQYTVSFDTAGGTPATIAPVKVNAGSGVGAGKWPDDPAKDEYQFDGWFEDTTQYTSATPITKDVTLVAKYSLRPAKYLGAFTAAGSKAAIEKAWGSNNLQTAFNPSKNAEDVSGEEVISAKYVVLHTRGGSGTNWQAGFDTISVIVQNEANNWAWPESKTDITAGAITRAANSDLFVVVDISKIKTYDQFKTGSSGKVYFIYGSANLEVELGLKAGYFTYQTLTKPEGAAALTATGIEGEVGFITDDASIFLGIDVPTTYNTVTFDTDSGTPAVADIEVGAGKSLGAQYPFGVVKPEFTFTGWFDESGVEYTARDAINGDLALKAGYVDAFKFPDITNATKWGDINAKTWPAFTAGSVPKYVIIASNGGGGGSGFDATRISEVQLVFKSDKTVTINTGRPPASVSTNEVNLSTGELTIAHSEDDIVYFIIELYKWPNYSNTGAPTFYLNYGEDRFGTWQAYLVDSAVSSIIKPDTGAVDFEIGYDKPAAYGYAVNITDVSTLFSTEALYTPVLSITYTGNSNGLKGVAMTLSATVEPDYATNKTIVWSSESSNVNISGNTLTATASGEITVKATIVNGKSATEDFVKEITITIAESLVEVTGIEGAIDETTLFVGQKVTLTGTVTPNTATNQTIVWSVKSGGTGNGTISSGVFTATAVGKVSLTATVTDGVTDGDYTEDFDDIIEVKDFPAIANATKLDDVGATQWSVDQRKPFKYFVIAMLGGGSKDGFGGIQLQLQGGSNTGADTIRTTGNWTSLGHDMEEDIVYLIVDLSDYLYYDDLIGVGATASWAQFRVNDGVGELGTYQGYTVDNTITTLTKPGDASADFTPTTGDDAKAAIKGYVTKTLPTELQ
jgi:uncharacterized protein YjdB